MSLSYNTFKCYYTEFDDIASFINILTIYNHTNKKDSEHINIKNVTILPICYDYVVEFLEKMNSKLLLDTSVSWKDRD